MSVGGLLQKSGGQLNEAQARSLLIGVGPAVPPPQLNGLESRATASIQPSWTHDPFARGASAQQPVGVKPAWADKRMQCLSNHAPLSR